MTTAAPTPPIAPSTATQPAKNGRPLWSYIVVTVLFLFLVLMQFLAENGEQAADQLAAPAWIRKLAQIAGSHFGSRFAYLPRPIEAHYVALVSISNETDGANGALSNPCAIRLFLARLLPRLAAAGPALIVSDIAPSDDALTSACPASAEESVKLAEAVIAAAKTTPIVLGQASYTLSQLPEHKAKQLEGEGFGETDLLLLKQMHLDPEPANVTFGLIRLNQHVDRVPILWFGHDSAATGARPVPALGLAAAEVYRSGFPDGERRLKDLESRLYHPIAELLPETAFSVVPATRLMCSDATAKPNWQQCAYPVDVAPDLMNQLHGRIVVIGFSDDPNDQWKTPFGQVPGYVLHANNIEALLDARAYRPLGFWGTAYLSIVWLLIVELPFVFLDIPIWKAIVIVITASLVVLFLAKYIALVNFGLYISPFSPSLLLIGVSLVHLLISRRLHR